VRERCYEATLFSGCVVSRGWAKMWIHLGRAHCEQHLVETGYNMWAFASNPPPRDLFKPSVLTAGAYLATAAPHNSIPPLTDKLAQLALGHASPHQHNNQKNFESTFDRCNFTGAICYQLVLWKVWFMLGRMLDRWLHLASGREIRLVNTVHPSGTIWGADQMWLLATCINSAVGGVQWRVYRYKTPRK